VRHDAASDEVEEHAREARLHDVAAEHHDDRSPTAGGGGDRVYDAQQIARGEDVG
jgi:hypothetical protein